MAKSNQDAEREHDSADTSGEIRRHSADRIAARAYELYLERGGSDGRDFDDWLTAEKELSTGPSQSEPKE
jgi:hypothetical protein